MSEAITNNLVLIQTLFLIFMFLILTRIFTNLVIMFLSLVLLIYSLYFFIVLDSSGKETHRDHLERVFDFSNEKYQKIDEDNMELIIENKRLKKELDSAKTLSNNDRKSDKEIVRDIIVDMLKKK